MHIAWSPEFVLPLPEGHRFPMQKYEWIPEQLCYEGIIRESDLKRPEIATSEHLTWTHTSEYLHRLRQQELTASEIRKIGFPLSEALVEREFRILQGTLECAYAALKTGVALNVAGGTHHAFSNRGEGFCVLNDIAFAANVLLREKQASKILVVDLDVHQGNGTAALFHNNPHVFTFSMHGEKNYPMHKEQSDLDIELPDACTDTFYLKTLKSTLPRLIEQERPNFIFYQAGVDILETDKLGRLAITTKGCESRDRFVFEQCKQYQIPVAVSMGGGYSPQLKTIVDAHVNTFRQAASIFL
ncbi:MAG: histone deacetylase family protein [Bacteroidia bacterium]